MSDLSCANEIPPVEDACSKEPKLNGDLCADAVETPETLAPNNNVCEVVSPDCLDSEANDVNETKNECASSASAGEDNGSIEEASSVDSQCEPEPEPDPYAMEDDDEEKDPEEDVRHSNGVIKKSSKRKKLSSGPGRGRPRKEIVAMYHSQISGDKNTIKIRIKKNFTALTPNKKKSGRRKKHRQQTEDPDEDEASDYEKQRPKRSKSSAGGGDEESNVSSTQEPEPLEQSPWGDVEKMPEPVLDAIFGYVVAAEGCLPNLVRFSKVCKLWRDISLKPSLWWKADLNFVKEKARTDLRLHWLILNRLVECQDLNMGEWKVRDIQTFLEALCEHCKKLKGLNLSGWKGITPDHLKYLTTESKQLERLDLSFINSTSPINAQPLVNLSQTMASRLTHLVLAHNKIANLTQIMTAISTNCPNLQLLDLSNIGTFAHNMSLLHVEKLQIGCPKLRVLRITNSQIWLAPATLTEQVASPGFPQLEELSLAGLEEDQTTTSRSVDDDCMERLLKSSKKLRLLDVRGCSKLTDSGLVRVPAWDLEHLFLSACYITRLQDSGLELVLQKWAHSLIEVDLAWSTATSALDGAVCALAEKGPESKLITLNLCGSSVSLPTVKAVLSKCLKLRSINLQSCRALPRGIKRLYTGKKQIDELREALNRTEQPAAGEEEGSPSSASPQNKLE
nr:unnamed protein product [Callosobruchus chinensis]